MKKPHRITLVPAYSEEKRLLMEIKEDSAFKKLAETSNAAVSEWIEEGRTATIRRRQQEKYGKLMLVLKEHFERLQSCLLNLSSFHLIH